MKTEQQIEESFRADLKALLEKYGAKMTEEDCGRVWFETDGVMSKDGKKWVEHPCYFTIP